MALKDDIILRIGATTASARKALDRLKGYASDIAGSFGLFGAGVAAGGVGAAIKSLVDNLDDLAKSSRSLDLTVERLSDLERAIGSITQLNRDDLVDLFQTIREQVGEAIRDPEGAGAVFREIGLAAEDLSKLGVDEILLKLVDALALVRDESRRAAIGAELFEDKWRQVELIVKEGSQSVEAMAQEMRAIGGPTTEMAEQAEAFNGEMAKLNENLARFAYALGPTTIRALSNIAKAATPRAPETTVAGILARDIADVEAKLKILDQEIESSFDVDPETLRQADKYRELLKSMRDTLDELGRTPATELPVPEAAEPGADPTVAFDQEREQSAKSVTKSRKTESNAQISDTRAQANAEGEIWLQHHMRINALQEQDAKAAAAAAERAQRALEQLERAGASTELAEYYRDLLGLTDEEVVPKVKMGVSVSESALADMPRVIRESLAREEFVIKIVPELYFGEGPSPLGKPIAQIGHDES